MDINDVCDYIIITETGRGGRTLTLQKLQKLIYYAQAWYLAFQGESLFRGRFQAWPQGPVNRKIYDRFAAMKSLQSQLEKSDVSETFLAAEVPMEKRAHLDQVLRAYGKYQDCELQEMMSREAPWQEARGAGAGTCEHEIDENHMRRFYSVSYLAALQISGSQDCACVLDAVSCGR